ncbi:hypothetical protein [Erwinia tracheiphila]|uniref:hypothetical protein n=1 Tax=Erwinia tracheiphila TaxID=65700 RepID=UPI000AE3823C
MTSNWWRTHPVLFRRDARGKNPDSARTKATERPGKTDRLGRRDEPYIPPRKEEYEASKTTSFRVRRRAVGRRHSRMNRFRRTLTRRGKTSENDGALLHFPVVLLSGIKPY